MASFSALSEYFSGLVHPSVADDPVASRRHCSFIASHLIGGMLAFAAMPLILLMRGGAPAPVEIAVFAWLTAPMLVGFDLSRTGRLERAHFLSIACFAGLICAVAAMSGGVSSFALIWLPVLAFEAAFSGSRRVIVASLGLAAFVVIALLAIEAGGGFVATSEAPGVLPQLSALMAVLYAAGLALRWDTIRVHTEDVRRSNEAQYQLLAENMTDLVTRHTANGAVEFASQAAHRVLGVQAGELNGRGLFERVHVADRPAYMTALSKAARGAASSAEFRVRHTASGLHGSAPQFVWVEMRCRPVEPGLEDAAPYPVIAVTREISERKAQQDGLQQARVDADRANAAKGRFLANVSHELRTPLNAIIGFSELLANGEASVVDPERRQEYAGLIHDSGLHLLSVVNGILDISRIESGNFAIVPEPFALSPVIESCLQLFALKAESASVALCAEVVETLPEVVADKRACRQILINLVSNAIKFTPAGGSVCISVHEEAESLRIEVADTGVGISDGDLPNIGTSFFQARSTYDRPYEGTGLGLSVVKGLVALHGGSFEVRSTLGQGTCVVIRLPKVTEDASHQVAIDVHMPRSRQAAMG